MLYSKAFKNRSSWSAGKEGKSRPVEVELEAQVWEFLPVETIDGIGVGRRESRRF